MTTISNHIPQVSKTFIRYVGSGSKLKLYSYILSPTLYSPSLPGPNHFRVAIPLCFKVLYFTFDCTGTAIINAATRNATIIFIIDGTNFERSVTLDLKVDQDGNHVSLKLKIFLHTLKLMFAVISLAPVNRITSINPPRTQIGYNCSALRNIRYLNRAHLCPLGYDPVFMVIFIRFTELSIIINSLCYRRK